jgi:hypothetical protein
MALPSLSSVGPAQDSSAVLKLREKLVQHCENVDRAILESPRFRQAAQLRTDALVQRSYEPQPAAPDSPAVRRTLDKLVNDLSRYTPQIDARRITP